MSLALAYAIGGVLAYAGVVLSLLYTGSALATTAIGMLIPILSDTGDIDTQFGTYLLGAGSAGEFGPILLVTLVLSAQSTLHNGLILLTFVGLAATVAVLAVRSATHTIPLFARTLESSSSSPSAGSWCWCSRSRCSPPNSASTCCWAGSRPG